MEHLFTVDVEEHFQVHALEPYVARSDWSSMESRVERSMERLYGLLAEAGARATFFVLGCLAERKPALVPRMIELGHEVASHGWAHHRVSGQTPAAFREDVRRSKALLEDQAGRPVIGYRAPSFSITPGVEWAFDVLLEEGYVYDSSIFPIRRPGYGYPGAPRDPHVLRLAAGQLIELPLNTLTVGPARLPAAGGAYLRHLPYGMIRAAFRQQARRGVPGMFFLHPWEVDPGQPRLPVPPLTRMRHYGGLARTEGRVARLLSEFRFESVLGSRVLGLSEVVRVEEAAPVVAPELSA